MHFYKLGNEKKKKTKETERKRKKCQEQNQRKTELIEELKNEYELSVAKGEAVMKLLEEELSDVSNEFLEMRKQLETELKKDEKKLRLLTHNSNNTMKFLESANSKGEQIKLLMYTCSKLETEKDALAKYLPLCLAPEADEQSDATDSKPESQEMTPAGERKDVETSEVVTQISLGDDLGRPQDDLAVGSARETELKSGPFKRKRTPQKSAMRPKTAFMRRLQKRYSREGRISSPDETPSSTPARDKTPALKKIVITEKASASSETSSSSDITGSEDVETLKSCFDNLQRIEQFWLVYNKAEIDLMELKTEKKMLAVENKQLRGTIRAVLEAAALAKSIPDSRVSTRVASRSRTARSAPPRRLLV